MYGKNGTANNVASNFIKFWPAGPFQGQPAEVISDANYNYFSNAAGKNDLKSVYISQPYLDFKDGSNQMIFSISRTLNVSNIINAMVFFIIQIKLS